MEDNKKFYTVQDIQKILCIGRNKAITLLKTEGFPAIKIGRTYRVDSDDFNKWLEEQKIRTRNSE